MQDRYLNPFTDFGFKKLFGDEANKDILINFLNSLLEGKEVIKNLTFKNTEKLGSQIADRKAIFDLYCENEQGEKFIIELQKTEQKFFKDRSLYYSTFPIQEQADKGDWNFELKAVYLIGILNFVFDEDEDSPNYKHEVQLRDKEHLKVFYDKLTFIYLEMPKFNKHEDELETVFDKWMYTLKFLPALQDRPKLLKERVFKKLFDIAELNNLAKPEYDAYNQSLKYYRDLNNSINTADYKGYERGREEGREEGKYEQQLSTARSLKDLGLSVEKISQATGLSQEEINKLCANKN